MRKFMALILVISAVSIINPANGASSLVLTQTQTEKEVIYKASLPSDITLKSDFKVDWRYEIDYLTPEGFVGRFEMQKPTAIFSEPRTQQVTVIDLRTAEFRFFLPLNGKYRFLLEASILNSGKKSVISTFAEYNLNSPSNYSIPEIPRDAIPGVQVPAISNGDEIIQVRYGADYQKAGSSFSQGYQLAEDVKLVNSKNNSLISENGDGSCEGNNGELKCIGSSVPGINIVDLTKPYYLGHRIFYSNTWSIVIYNENRDERAFSYSFKNKIEINVDEWNQDRSRAPDANGAKAGLDCPSSFNGTVLSCSFTPKGKNKESIGNPVWLDIWILADNIEQKKLTKLVKTKLGTKTSLKFQLPTSYKDLEIVARTMGIGGTSENQKWVSTKPVSAATKQKSYKSGYGSVMISSQDNLRAMNFYSMATGADGRVVRSKAESWCRYALQSQIFRGEISSTNDWIRGCTDAAMKL
jgi:hypothetical protein